MSRPANPYLLKTNFCYYCGQDMKSLQSMERGKGDDAFATLEGKKRRGSMEDGIGTEMCDGGRPFKAIRRNSLIPSVAVVTMTSSSNHTTSSEGVLAPGAMLSLEDSGLGMTSPEGVLASSKVGADPTILIPEKLVQITKNWESNKASFSFTQNEWPTIENFAAERPTTEKNQGIALVTEPHTLLRSIHTGVYAHQGQKEAMEDVYTVIKGTLMQSNGRSRMSFLAPIIPDVEPQLEHAKDMQTECDGSPLSETIASFADDGPVAFFALCDGHGGIQAAEYANAHLQYNIQTQESFRTDPEKAIIDGFMQTEEDFTKFALRNGIDGGVGTTATAVVILGDTLFIGNVGDSEAVLSCKGKAIPLTVSHKPESEEEQKRVAEVGGVILDAHKQKRLGHPVWNAKLINIGVTRAIGDLYFKDPTYVGERKSGLTAEPFVQKRILSEDDEFLILATDGFWDVVSHQEAIGFVNENMLDKDTDTICKELLELSRTRLSRDNITVVLVKL